MDDDASPSIDRRTYWKRVRRRSLLLLSIWFVAGYVLSIFLAEPLNAFTLGGMPFGFWMAQQGSIFVFVGLVIAYAVMTGRLDRRAGVQSDNDSSSPQENS